MVKLRDKDYFVLIDDEAVEVWVENGMVIFADNFNTVEYENTMENREMCIQRANEIIKNSK